ncbi:hypothetical protein GCM10017612_34720 [Novosphingobium resinovorum]|nr:hypothetical protein GCM10017612_34720 [Novosphingobium resinovorum]
MQQAKADAVVPRNLRYRFSGGEAFCKNTIALIIRPSLVPTPDWLQTNGQTRTCTVRRTRQTNVWHRINFVNHCSSSSTSRADLPLKNQPEYVGSVQRLQMFGMAQAADELIEQGAPVDR